MQTASTLGTKAPVCAAVGEGKTSPIPDARVSLYLMIASIATLGYRLSEKQVTTFCVTSHELQRSMLCFIPSHVIAPLDKNLALFSCLTGIRWMTYTGGTGRYGAKTRFSRRKRQKMCEAEK